MIQDYNGHAVVDLSGARIGTVERSYVDDTGAVRVVGVKMGTLRPKHRLVPVDDAIVEKNALTVPYPKRLVEASPEAETDDTLEAETLARVRAYYAGAAGGRPQMPDHGPDAEDTRQRDPDVPPRPAAVPEAQRADTPETAGPLSAEAGALGQVRDLGDTIEVPIVEEKLVKRPVVKEVLRIRKSTITEQQEVSEDLRKEDVDIDHDGDVAIQDETRQRS